MEDFEKTELNETELETEANEAVSETVENTSVEPKASDITETAENAETDSENATESEPVKKGKVQKPIIIAACVLIIALIAAGVYYLFFNNSIVGTWVIETPSSSADEASSSTSEENEKYYTFNDDGTASIKLGTIEIFGEWNYADAADSSTDSTNSETKSSEADDNSKSKIDITILPIIKGTFDFNLEGNGFSGRKLTLSSNSASLTFKSTAKVDPELKVSKKFKTDKTITGKWKNKDYNLVYLFNADGTCDLNNNDRITTTGTYTVDTSKKQITIVYIGEKKSKMYIPYSKGEKKNQIVLSGYTFTKVKE